MAVTFMSIFDGNSWLQPIFLAAPPHRIKNGPGLSTRAQCSYMFIYVFLQTSGISPHTTLNQLSTNIVLPDDMMTLTLDTSSTGTLHVVNIIIYLLPNNIS